MGRACCILGCPSGGDIPSHQIPKNPALFNKWKSIIFSEKIQHLTDEQISKCAVCYRHFSNDDYLVTFKVRKLKRGVAPSLNLPNRPAASSSNSKMVLKKEIKTEPADSEEESETYPVALFEDLPETLDDYFLKSSEQDSPDDRAKQIDSMTNEFESKYKPRRKRRLTEKQLILLRCKKQAELYAKTATIQKLLSSLTLDERLSVQSKIRKSRYSPKVYVKIYHDIAKRKALGQL